MRKNYVKLPLFIAALYFGSDLHAQSTQDTTAKEKKIEEVVVIGYGKAKKVDLTGAISQVKGEELSKTPTALATQALQGKATGVQVISNGSPGESPKINIRGLSSINGDNQPLYVVDGIFADNIDFLTPSDIQDISILKDASSSAIYGRRATSGVVVITTKGGSYNRKAKLTYSSFYGVQKANNVIKMANAEQFTNFALESGSTVEINSIDAAIQRYGRSRVNPNLPNVNTDWYKETLQLAGMQNHNLSVEGGSDKVAYSLGGDFFRQDGILKMKNSFERFNIRAKIDAKANDWLTVGANAIYSRSDRYDDESSAWQAIYYAVPVLPVYDPAYSGPTPYADARAIGYRDSQNPFALLDNSDLLKTKRTIVLNTYADFSILPKQLSFKTSLSYSNRADNERNVLLPYYVTDSFQRSIGQSSIERVNYVEERYIWDNVLTYNKNFGKHDITAILGSAFNDDSFLKTTIQGNFDPAGAFDRNREETWYIQNTSVAGRTSSDWGDRLFGLSYFGRLAYKYDNKYIAYATLRNEGSNKYAEKRKYMPAFGVSWIASEESFLKDVSYLNLLKFRAGWGRLANNNADRNRFPSSSTTSTAIGDQNTTGALFSTYLDNVKWEFVEELNLGLNTELFNRHLSIEADYFVRDTKDMQILQRPIVGNEASRVSIATMRNRGVEVSANWKGKVNENLGYSISGNFSRIKNEITDLGRDSFVDAGVAEFPQRYAVGQPALIFYGYDIVGVYQNQAEINADPTAAGNSIKPGYFRYRDVNGDGKLTADDRIYLGSPIPKYYFGGTVTVNYKNWDLSMAIYGQGGNVIFNTARAEVFRTAGRNIDAELAVNRWHGEGTSNEFVSSEGYRNSWNWKNSKFWLEKGDFVRIQNIQLGYNLKMQGVPEMRFTLTADRPFTWSKSKNLMNPEVNNNGLDTGIYPTPSVFTFGYSIKF